jgi:hypothetical protein
LIQVVEEKLPHGAQGWIKVAALYQHSSGELVLHGHKDVKHWIKKCCHTFKKLTGTPGDPKRDMILRCQWIQQRIHAKSASLILGVDSGGDNGLSINEEELEEELVAVLDDVDNPGGDPVNNDYNGELGDGAGVAAVRGVSRGETPLGVDVVPCLP